MKKTIQLFFIFFSLISSAQVSFLSAVNFAVCTGTGSICYQTSVASADFNSDGKTDLVLVGNFWGTAYLKVFKGDGAGGFTLARSLSPSFTNQYIISADFNNDGRPDLATANYPSNTISVRCGTTSVPGFSFTATTSFTTGGGAMAITSGDFNNDGKTDLVSANENTNNISILIGNGLGGFSSSMDFSVGNYPRSLTSGDFNADGKLDIAVGNYGSNNISILLGNGIGSFGNATNFSVGSAPESISSADFNGDGKPDLVTANENSNTVSVLIGNGSGSFGTASDFPVGSNPNSVFCNDLNGDGKIDLAVANSSSNNISILIGNGLGGFNNMVFFPAGNNPFSVIGSDFNGDGKIDLATANNGLDSSSVLLNASFAGIEVLEGNDLLSVSIFPSPANGEFSVEILNKEFISENIDIKIRNALGQEMKKEKLLSKKQQFNISELNEGVYYVQLIQNDRSILTKKMIIQK